MKCSKELSNWSINSHQSKPHLYSFYHVTILCSLSWWISVFWRNLLPPSSEWNWLGWRCSQVIETHIQSVTQIIIYSTLCSNHFIRSYNKGDGSEVITVVILRGSIFWDIMACSLVKGNHCFGEIYPQLQSWRLSQTRHKHEACNKQSSVCVTSQKRAAPFIVTATRLSDPNYKISNSEVVYLIRSSNYFKLTGPHGLCSLSKLGFLNW
jgi:hypothetical protein